MPGGGVHCSTLEILAAYDAAPVVTRACCVGRAFPAYRAWRKARERALAGLAVHADVARTAAERIARLEQEKRQLGRSGQTRFVVDVQAKLHALWRRSPRARTPAEVDAMTDRRANWPDARRRDACLAVGASQAGTTGATSSARHPAAAPVPHRDRHQPRPSAPSSSRRSSTAAQRPVRRHGAGRGGPRARRRCLPGLAVAFYRRYAGRREPGRRRQATHPATVKPELVAYQPNSVWSGHHQLRGPAKWTYYHLYVIWTLSRSSLGGGRHRESAALAEG